MRDVCIHTPKKMVRVLIPATCNIRYLFLESFIVSEVYNPITVVFIDPVKARYNAVQFFNGQAVHLRDELYIFE